MFDALALDLSDRAALRSGPLLSDFAREDMAWLSQEGLLTTLGGLAALGQRKAHTFDSITVQGTELVGPVIEKPVRAMARAGVALQAAYGIRRTAADLRSRLGIDAVAVPQAALGDLDAPATRDVVIRITLLEFPTPSELTPWEEITEFRGNSDARAQWFRLKRWMNDMARSNLKPFEISDQLRALAADYEESLRISRLQYKRSALEIILSTTAEIAENLVKLNWAKATKSALDVTRHSAQPLAAERT